MKNRYFFVIFLIITISSKLYSQIGNSYSQIIEKKGKPIETKYDTNGKIFSLIYDLKKNNEVSNFIIFYMNEDGICSQIKILAKFEEKNDWIDFFNVQYKKIGDMKWIDNKNIIYEMELDKPGIIIRMTKI